jgi:ribonuclease Z
MCRFECVPVRHCPDASAVILEHPSGAMRMAYSGDCRPSTRLADAARGVHVFVHEATFEDDLADHAESKRHSTTSEALRTTTRAGAKLAVLTHFSQRYPRAVAAVDGATGAPAVTAFDGARVRWDRLETMPDVARRVDAMFAAARDAEAADRDQHRDEDDARGDATGRERAADEG